MTADGPPGGAGGIIPAMSYAPAKRPSRRDFKAWHRPRKQLVRREQWLAEASWVLQQRRTNDKSPLRYLGLPGADLLDLRFLYRALCEPQGLRMRFLGFDDSASPESAEHVAFNVSLTEVRQMALMDEQSEVRPENIRLLSDHESLAWAQATNLGPYDIINLDLCEDFAKDAPNVDGSLYTAITRIFGLQDRWPTPWVFLLTTRLDQGAVYPETWSLLVRLAQRCLRECPGLAGAVATAYPEFDVSAALADDEHSFVSAVLAISLWMSTLATAMNSSLELSSSFSYTIAPRAETPDIVSLAFRFTPRHRPLHDAAGLALPVAPSSPTPGCEDASALPGAISATVDADTRLEEDGALMTQMVDEMAALLREARYDVDQYRAWVAAYGRRPPARRETPEKVGPVVSPASDN